MPPVTRSHAAVVIGLLLVCSAITPLPATADTYEPGIVHDVDALDNGNLLVSEGGIPGASPSGAYEIDLDGNIIWSYTTGLAWTHNADMQPDSTVVISDTNNDRVIIVSRGGSILWSTDDVTFSDGSTSISGTGPYRLNGPHNADRLADGNTIIADSHNDRILEVSPAGSIAWLYASGLDWPRDADRLASGNTLVNDSGNFRIIEVTSGGSVVWEYSTTDLSYDSDRLSSGNTLIGSGGSIVEVDPSGTIVWSYPDAYVTETIEGYLVTAPNGNLLWTKIIQPRADLYPGEIFPAIVCMTGGLGAGEAGNQRVADNGIIEFHLNVEGRGVLHPSDGEEDCNGFIHQDDLKALIEFALARENVDMENVGVITGSYGITAGAGCLGRYPSLPIKYLIDLEGPSDSFVTCMEPWSLDGDPSNDRHEAASAIFGHSSTYRDSSAANVA